MDSWKHELAILAERQHGIVSYWQTRVLASSESAARHELGQTHWAVACASVYRLRGSPVTEHQQVMIAVMACGPGAVVSHRTAAALWDLPGESMLPVHVTRIRDTNTLDPPDAVVHQARHLPADQVTVLHGIPVTRPERIPFDLANIGIRAERIERIVDRLWSDRLVSGPSLRRVKNSLPRRGFRGTALLRELLDARSDDWVPPASGLESRVMTLLEQHGLDGFDRQVDLGGDEWVGRVDFVHPKRRVVIEVQSDRHHAALSSRRDDTIRHDRLRRAGFCVITVWEDHVWHRPGDWLEQVRLATT